MRRKSGEGKAGEPTSVFNLWVAPGSPDGTEGPLTTPVARARTPTAAALTAEPAQSCWQSIITSPVPRLLLLGEPGDRCVCTALCDGVCWFRVGVAKPCV